MGTLHTKPASKAPMSGVRTYIFGPYMTVGVGVIEEGCPAQVYPLEPIDWARFVSPNETPPRRGPRP